MFQNVLILSCATGAHPSLCQAGQFWIVWCMVGPVGPWSEATWFKTLCY